MDMELKRPKWDFDIPQDTFQLLLDNFVVGLKTKFRSLSEDRWDYLAVLEIGGPYGSVEQELVLEPKEWNTVRKYFDIDIGGSILTPTSLGQEAENVINDMEAFDQEYEDEKREYERLKKIFE